jgi:hypothetical protein
MLLLNAVCVVVVVVDVVVVVVVVVVLACLTYLWYFLAVPALLTKYALASSFQLWESFQ